MDRRNFIKKIGAGSLVAGTVMAGATPALAAKKRVNWKLVTTWPDNLAT